MRGIIGELKVQDESGFTIIDMEAGLELFGRGTPGPSDLLLAVCEPSVWSLHTALRVIELAAELGIPRVGVVVNKVQEAADVEWVRAALGAEGNTAVEIVAAVPYDRAVSLADRKVQALLDVAPGCAAVVAIEGLADRLLQRTDEAAALPQS